MYGLHIWQRLVAEFVNTQVLAYGWGLEMYVREVSFKRCPELVKA